MKKTFLIIIILLLTLPTLSSARLIFNPYVNLSEEYNDNIYLDPDHEESDWITTIEPGILLNYDARNLTAELDYALRYRLYADNSGEDETSLSDVQRAHGQLTLFPEKNFKVDARGSISRVIVDDRENSSTENDFINKATLYQYLVSPSYRLRLGSSMALQLAYTFEQSLYKKIEENAENPYDVNDYLQQTGEIRFLKKIFSRGEAFLSYAYIDYQEDRRRSEDINGDYDRQDAIIGFEYPLRRLTFHAQAGRSWVDYDDAEQGDAEATIWEVGLDYQPTETWGARLNYSNGFATSVSRGLSETEDLRFALGYHRRFELTAELFANKTTFEEDNSEDQGLGSLLSFSYPLGRRFNLDLTADWATFDYQETGIPDETVDRFGCGAGLSYELKHITASLRYDYRRNNSDDQENDYTNNIVLFQLSWKLRSDI